MADTHSIPCECDAVNAELDVYEDENAPYTTHWATLSLDGEAETSLAISADVSHDIERAIAIGLQWLRSKEYKKMEPIYKQGFIIVCDRQGIHAYEASCKKLTKKVK